MRRFAVIVMLAVAAVGCGGALKEPDAGSGQLGGIGGGNAAGGTTGTPGAGGIDSGITILDVRPPDEPCSLEQPALPVAGATCFFDLPPPSCSYASNSRIDVRVGDLAIPRDPSDQNGWDYTDATQTMVVIYGASCDAVTAGGNVTIIYRVILP